MHYQHGSVHANRIALRDWNVAPHIKITIVGPKGAGPTVEALSLAEARGLFMRLGHELADDAKRRADSAAARALLDAVNDARDECDGAINEVERYLSRSETQAPDLW